MEHSKDAPLKQTPVFKILNLAGNACYGQMLHQTQHKQTQHKQTQHKQTQHNGIQHNDTQQNDFQHNNK
jgi:hypothetical protein